MSAWIGPAIIAAVISAIVTAAGWYVTHRSGRQLETDRRRERILDVQTALRAEIRSHQHRLALFATQEELDAIAERIEAANNGETPFTPFIPREVEAFVFDAVVGEVHILPTEVIDPVVLYYRQVKALAQFVDDLRSERFDELEASRKAEMFRDYVAMGVFALELADEAIDAINQSLAAGRRDQ
jgi:hypothetical protein